MKNIDIHGMANMELIRGEIAEWYWATDYIHGDLYEAEELFRQGHLVRSVKKRWCVLCMAARFWKGFRGIFVLCRTGKDGL